MRSAGHPRRCGLGALLDVSLDTSAVRPESAPCGRPPSRVLGSRFMNSPAQRRNAMRVAALYDIHGNPPALDAVLAETATLGCARIVVGGAVALGPMPRETPARLVRSGARVGRIRANWHRETGGAR